jgi:hypothetical protein
LTSDLAGAEPAIKKASYMDPFRAITAMICFLILTVQQAKENFVTHRLKGDKTR